MTKCLAPQRGQLASMAGSPWKSSSFLSFQDLSAGSIFSTLQPQWKRNLRVSSTLVCSVSVIFSTSTLVRLLSHSRSASGWAARRTKFSSSSLKALAGRCSLWM